MAKRRKKRAHTKKRASLAAPKKHRRRRRRLGAGDKMFKMLSNPIAGGLAGAVAGYIGAKVGKKIMKSEMGGLIGSGVVVVLLHKKAPFAAAGAVGGGAVGMVEGYVAKLPATSMIAKLLNEDANFVNDSDMLNDSPIILSDDGRELPYKLQEQLNDLLLSEMEDSYYGGMGSDMDSMNDED